MFTTFKLVCAGLTIFAALCWGLIGFFNYDLVAQLFGNDLLGTSNAVRILYAIVGVAGVVTLLDMFGLLSKK